MHPSRLPVLLGVVAASALLLTSCQGGTAAAPAAIPAVALPSRASSTAPSSTSAPISDSQASDAVSESSKVTDTPAATSPAAVHPAATTGGKGACSLISQQEATTAIGSAVGAGVLSGNVAAGYTDCEFDTPDLVTGSLSVYLVTVNGKADFLHATSKMTGRISKVGGIGDGAFGTFAGAHAAIEFYRGDTLVTIILVTASGPVKDKAMALAGLAAGRV